MDITTVGSREMVRYSRDEWAATAGGFDVPSHPIVPVEEIREVVLPLSQWLREFIFRNTPPPSPPVGIEFEPKAAGRDVRNPDADGDVRAPRVIGVTGSVTVGKSTFSGALKSLIEGWPSEVSTLTTDNFLFPNEVLLERGIMHRKGFPESYDLGLLSEVLRAFRAGESMIRTPIYSHEKYNILLEEFQTLKGSGVLILEGVLVGRLHEELDATVYLDAEEEDLEAWFRRRTSNLRRAAVDRPDSFFYQFREMSEEDLAERSSKVWRDINLINLREHILPYREFADVILRKDRDHRTTEVLVRGN